MSEASMTHSSDPNNVSLGTGVLIILLSFLLVVALWTVAGIAGAQAREQGAFTLRETVLDTAMQCYAIEGCYPVSLEYMQDNYGLSINEDEYNVIYEVFASNVIPSVVVSPK